MTDDRVTNFKKLKKLISALVPPLKVLTDLDSRYETYFDRSYETRSQRSGNRIKKDKLWFTALIIQKEYLGFYFMPIYSHLELLKDLSADLKKLLKGKSCFHIRDLDENKIQEIKKHLEKGFKIYTSLPQ